MMLNTQRLECTAEGLEFAISGSGLDSTGHLELTCPWIIGLLFIDKDLVEHYGSNSSHGASHGGREGQTRYLCIGAGRSWSGTRDRE